ncbi:biopolymer transporter ExbB [Stenotrophomonas panacihumi]|uniref:Biopolymer transporter ExbB n=1 Tax=Stenotrophomonas panacihumi TaxID=676599 RepID=A0A0R0B0J9_9GAMM|nr:MotA/TolQ/ExbB proton channel family protein [Stenotrophomonas panacihumi]KRG47399.1 biopolymer transporter ExbB [Stenotrophomonas panacihumi]PTN55878.1 MotA/TolQ/ExbB proton channel family protein [Stenotrophomonas panacihumi]
MWELVKAGGWPMVPLLLLGVLALAIVLERLWTLRRNEVLPPGLGEEVRNWAARGKLDPSHIESLRRSSPLGALLAAALDMRGRPRELVRERIEDTGRHIVHRMERFLNALGTIASAGPLLGLLGTVVGMIQMFLGILDHGIGDVNQLAGGIGKALVCTATGMIIAVPALIFHRYLKGRVNGYVIEMEQEATLLLDALEGRGPAAAAPRPAAGQSAASPSRAPATAKG